MRNPLVGVFRQMMRNRQLSLINGLGLVLGLTVSALMFFYVYHEYGYDRYHDPWRRIYRVTSFYPQYPLPQAGSAYALTDLVRKNIPEIEEIGRLSKVPILVVRGHQSFNEARVFRADPSLFRIFSWEFLRGDPETALSEPLSIVLTASMAQKYFGRLDVLGEVLNVRTKRGARFDAEPHSCKVTGVIKDFPLRSHFQADMLLPMATIGWGYENMNRRRVRPSYEGWGWPGFYTFCLLRPESDALEIAQRLGQAFLEDAAPDADPRLRSREGVAFQLQPLKAIHLSGGQYQNEIAEQARAGRIKLFAGVAALVLIIAVINTLILSMAQAARRIREMGIRKVAGARQRDLGGQLLRESLLFAGLTLPLAVGLMVLLMPLTGRLLGVRLALGVLSEGPFIAGLLLMTLLTGLSAGTYVAVTLSRVSPVKAMTLRMNSGGKTHVRNGLIVIQLWVFIVLSILALVISGQVRYLFSGKNLGYHPTGVLSVEVKDRDFDQKYDAIKRELKSMPAVLAVSCSQSLGAANQINVVAHNQIKHPKYGSYWYSGTGRLSGPNVIQVQELAIAAVDPDFVPALGIKLKEGRNFDPSIPSDRQAILVNEAFVKDRQLDHPVGKVVSYIDEKRRVIGVVEDFHTGNLYEPVPPVILKWRAQWLNQLILKVDVKNHQAALAHLKAVWERFCPGTPLDYHYLEDDQQRVYDDEMRLGRLLAGFALLAILIAAMGLWGLAAFIAAAKTHEVGVRKVMGASVAHIIGLLTKDFMILVLIANLLAAPLAWVLAQRWLQQYAYRLAVSPVYFLFAGGASLVVTLLAVNLHVFKAARTNPVKTLRIE